MLPEPPALALRQPAKKSLALAWIGSTVSVLTLAGLAFRLNSDPVLTLVIGLAAVAAPFGSAVALRACRRDVTSTGLTRAGVLGVHAYIGICAGAITALLTVTAFAGYGAVYSGVDAVGLMALIYLFAAMAGVLIGGILGGLIAILAGVPASYLAFRSV